MPRITVTSEPNGDGQSATTFDEHVAPSDLEAPQAANQLIGRLGWAVHDADEVARGRRPSRLP